MINRLYRGFVSLCFSLLLVFGVASQAYGEQPSSRTADSSEQVVKRVGYVERVGFFQQDSNGTYSGVIIDYLTEISKYTGWKYEYISMGIDELPTALAESSVDLIGGGYYSPIYEETQSFPDYNAGRSRTVLLARWEDESIRNHEASTLEGKTIGISADAVNTRECLESFLNMYHVSANIKVYPVEESVDGSLDYYLESGQIDVLVARYADDSQKFRMIEVLDAHPCYIVCRKGDNETLDDLNFALRQINLSNPNFSETVMEKNFPDTQKQKFFLTEDEKAYLAEKKTIRVIIPEQLYPVSIIKEDSAPTGITPDLLERVAELTGLTVEYIPLKPEDAYPVRVAELFDETRADVVGCAVLNGGIFNGTGLSTSSAYVSLPRTYVRNKKTDFRRDGLVLASLNRQRAPSDMNPKEVLYFDTLEDVLEAINDGRADIGSSSTANIQYLQQLNFYPNVTTVTMDLEDVHYCFATGTHEDARLLTILNKAINSMSEDEMQQIQEGYLKLPERSSLNLFRELLYNNALKVTAFAVIFCCLVIAAIYMIFKQKVKNEKTALQLANAQSANKAKSAFLSNMSHDIRTPINGIIGMTHIAMQNLNDPVVLKGSLDKISHASTQLETLVNEVLEMSQIESGKMTLVEEPFDLRDLQRDIDSVIYSMTSRSEITYSFTSSIEHTKLIGSPVYLERVIMNVLTNAVKYTPAGGCVAASVEEKPIDETHGQFVITVTDNGIGISKEFLSRVFEPFAQEHPDAGTTYTGTGLGMSITKELVELMRGTIRISSELNNGTTVLIQLPLRYDLTKSEKEVRSESGLLGLRVLLVEDNELNSEIASYILRENGSEVETAENGRVAVELYESKPAGYYDIILMDLMMPVMDGYTATRTIRRRSKADAQSIPIIATTANAFIEDLQKCLEYGMNDHITKPLSIDELLTKIKKYCMK